MSDASISVVNQDTVSDFNLDDPYMMIKKHVLSPTSVIDFHLLTYTQYDTD